MDNTNEILILKNKISDLEQKLSLAEVRQSYRRRFNSESQDSKMEQILVNGEDIKDTLRAIISRGLYFFTPFFTVVYTAERVIFHGSFFPRQNVAF